MEPGTSSSINLHFWLPAVNSQRCKLEKNSTTKTGNQVEMNLKLNSKSLNCQVFLVMCFFIGILEIFGRFKVGPKISSKGEKN